MQVMTGMGRDSRGAWGPCPGKTSGLARKVPPPGPRNACSQVQEGLGCGTQAGGPTKAVVPLGLDRERKKGAPGGPPASSCWARLRAHQGHALAGECGGRHEPRSTRGRGPVVGSGAGTPAATAGAQACSGVRSSGRPSRSAGVASAARQQRGRGKRGERSRSSTAPGADRLGHGAVADLDVSRRIALASKQGTDSVSSSSTPGFAAVKAGSAGTSTWRARWAWR